MESTLSQREEELALQVAAKEDCDTKLHERDQESRTLKSQLDEVRTRIQACDDEKGIFQKQCDKVDKVHKSENSCSGSQYVHVYEIGITMSKII